MNRQLKLLAIKEWRSLAVQAKFKPYKLANLCHVSLKCLRQFVRTSVDDTVKRWVCHLRIEMAEILFSEGKSEKEVVAELGYTDMAHLCREFKARVGVTPSDYFPKKENLAPLTARKFGATSSKGVSIQNGGKTIQQNGASIQDKTREFRRIR